MVLSLSFCKVDTPKNDKKPHTKNKEIEIIFSENIVLKWDVDNNKFKKGYFYQKIKKSNENLLFLKKSITDTTDLGVRVCSKKKSLKKGDIAFLYLQDIGKIQLYSCLKIQFDVFEEKCPFPEGLLDYIEDNRKIVKDKVIKCYTK